jgi:hypothetical protein
VQSTDLDIGSVLTTTTTPVEEAHDGNEESVSEEEPVENISLPSSQSLRYSSNAETLVRKSRRCSALIGADPFHKCEAYTQYFHAYHEYTT